MRLSIEQRAIIERIAIKHFDKDVKVYLFGSRIYPEQKGGDIDLLLEGVPEELTAFKKKIDVVNELPRGRTPRYQNSFNCPSNIFS